MHRLERPPTRQHLQKFRLSPPQPPQPGLTHPPCRLKLTTTTAETDTLGTGFAPFAQTKLETTYDNGHLRAHAALTETIKGYRGLHSSSSSSSSSSQYRVGFDREHDHYHAHGPLQNSSAQRRAAAYRRLPQPRAAAGAQAAQIVNSAHKLFWGYSQSGGRDGARFQHTIVSLLGLFSKQGHSSEQRAIRLLHTRVHVLGLFSMMEDARVLRLKYLGPVLGPVFFPVNLNSIINLPLPQCLLLPVLGFLGVYCVFGG